jgi:hypothetical protein
MSNHKRRRYLVQQGWDHEQAIEYRYNRDGFRGSDFDVSIPGVMTLGCSFTFGGGLREEQAWPWMVAQYLGIPCYNLAWNGASSDRCWRMAEYWIPRLQPKYVVMLTPPRGRMELIVSDHDREAEGLMPERGLNEVWTKTWISVEENARLNEIKNQLAVWSLCSDFDAVPLIYRTTAFQLACGGRKADVARDFRHQGPAVHEAFAAQVCRDILRIEHK